MQVVNPGPNPISIKKEPQPQPASERAGFARWAALVYILVTGFAEAIFVELYCHWHGAQFLLPDPRKFYSPENIALLAKIDFVATVGPNFTGGPTVMSMTAEILMWSSLGIWARRISGMVDRYKETPPDPPRDLAVYIGILGSQTAVVAGVLILLKLSSFKVFGVSVDNFEATAGLAFLLGYFGDETIVFFTRLRRMIFGKRQGRANEQW
ncbi:MAG: hypothetical protein WBE38_20590 [Terracidiphilus sp.]